LKLLAWEVNLEAMFRTRGPVCSTAEPWAPDFGMSCLRPW
jgi:hypothetical protein